MIFYPETQAALDAIAEARNAPAAQALQRLAEEIIRVMQRLETSHDINKYLESLTIVNESPGMYTLLLKDRNSCVDPATLVEVATAAVENAWLNGSDYEKPLRHVAIE